MTPCCGAEALTANLVLTFQRFVSWPGFTLVRTSEVSLGLKKRTFEKTTKCRYINCQSLFLNTDEMFGYLKLRDV